MKVYRLRTRRLIKLALSIACVSLVTTVIFFLFFHQQPSDDGEKSPEDARRRVPEAALIDASGKVDWHDPELARAENERAGNGERGKAATLPANYDKNEFDRLYRNNGFSGLMSDFISVNRSVSDLRHRDCQKVRYRRELPKASVIIPVHNEHWSTLLRSVYSVLNRSPAELIKEIIIVDDGSTKVHMKKQLDDYVASNLPKVRVFHIPTRKGLITARLLGAHNATGQVLIFLDSHIEANINWLPPLLEPIAENYKTCVCPFIDVIDYETFEIRAQDEGARGAFDWELFYKRLPLLPEDKVNPTKPFKSPVMAGGLFAISSRFFWELGGYDPGLQIWGGEQYELSFKIWQCGGSMVDAPCSRVAHIYRGKYSPFANPGIGDFVGRNYKRVAEVWMDEYAEYLYMRRPHYRSIDPGDLSAQREIRERLKCKPFKWFMEEIAFDLVKRYPPIQPPDYGSGHIKPLYNDQLCLTTVSDKPVTLGNCLLDNKDQRQQHQEFVLSWHKDIEVKGTPSCLDVSEYGAKASVSLFPCHRSMGNQLWRYDLETQQLLFGTYGNRCLACVVESRKVFVENCDTRSRIQKWTIDFVDKEALKKWKETGPFVGQ